MRYSRDLVRIAGPEGAGAPDLGRPVPLASEGDPVREPGGAAIGIMGRSTQLLALALSLSWLGCGAPGAGPSATETEQPDGVPVDVQVVSPARGDITRRVELPASVGAFETTTLLSKVSGYLSRIDVDIGDTVRRGQFVAKIEVPEIVDELREAEAELEATRAHYATAEAELESSQAELDLRQITFERIQAVRQDEPDVMPQQTLDEARAEFELARAAVKVGESRMNQIESAVKQAQAAMKRLQTLIDFSEIHAPYDGIVTERHVDPGTLLQAETSSRMVQQIVTIASMDRVRLRSDVPESQVPFVQVGDPAVVTLDSMPSRVFEGSVTRFAGVLDPATRTMRIEIDLANPELILRPGMYGRATLSLDTRSEALTIPADALRVDGATTYVYCAVDGLAKRFDVETAVGDGVRVEVRDGLEGDERVVVSARGPIADGARVNSAEFRPEQAP